MAKSKGSNIRVRLRKSEEDHSRNSDGKVRSRKVDGEIRDRKSDGEVRSRNSDGQDNLRKSSVEVRKSNSDGESRSNSSSGGVWVFTSGGEVRISTKEGSRGSIDGGEKAKASKPSVKYVFVEGDYLSSEKAAGIFSDIGVTTINVERGEESLKLPNLKDYPALHMSQRLRRSEFYIKLPEVDLVLHRDGDYVWHGVKEKQVERRSKLDVEFAAGMERMKKYFDATIETFTKAVAMHSDSVFTGVMAGNKKKGSRNKGFVKAEKKAH